MFLLILLLVIAFFDLYWMLRLIYTRILSHVLPTIRLDEAGCVYSICWTTDIDYFGHMNNGKYFKEMDFGRFDFYFRSGLSAYIEARPKMFVVQHAASIKYRKSINFLVPFKHVTKLLYWDDRSLYFEQSFISLHDGFVRAVAFSKNTCVGGSVMEMMERFGHPSPPQCPEDLKMWLESQEVTSCRLRQQSNIHAGSGCGSANSLSKKDH